MAQKAPLPTPSPHELLEVQWCVIMRRELAARLRRSCKDPDHGPLRVGVIGSIVMVSKLPDLIVTRLIIPAGLAAGVPVTFAAVVKNQGTAATPAGVVVGVAFHVDGPEVAWSDTDTASLAPGASVTLTATGGPAGAAWKATAGNHIVNAIVNDVHRFAETSTTNNSLAASFSVAAVETKPVNTALPVISGIPVVNGVLAVSNGSWS